MEKVLSTGVILSKYRYQRWNTKVHIWKETDKWYANYMGWTASGKSPVNVYWRIKELSRGRYVIS